MRIKYWLASSATVGVILAAAISLPTAAGAAAVGHGAWRAPPSAHAQHADYYYHHHHYRHRRWDRHRRHWHYYN